MANKLQKFLFNLSTMSPLIIILALVYWIEENIPFFVHKESEPLQIDFRSICLSLIIIFALLFPMNDERIIYPMKKVILEPIDRIGEIIIISNQSQWGTTIAAEMMVELDGEPIYFFERHYDTMKSLQFFVTSDSIRFFWEKDEKTDKEIKM